MFLVKGQDLDMRISHSATYKWFNTTKDKFKTERHFSGNTQGYLYPSRYFESVVVPNAECALDPNCIAPAHSNVGNHRFDQTSLSILAYHPKVRAPHYTEYVAVKLDQLSRNLQKPSPKFVWTSRNSFTYYSKLEVSMARNEAQLKKMENTRDIGGP